jgi:hypothetical protein
VRAVEVAEVDSRTVAIGRELLNRARQQPGRTWWSEQMLRWALKNPAFKVQLLRFVDVFPMLSTFEQVYDCLVDYLSQPDVTLPDWLGVGLQAGRLAKGGAGQDRRRPDHEGSFSPSNRYRCSTLR